MKSKGTILVVDDDLLIRKGLLRMLSQQGYEVEEAEDAEAAQKLLPQRFFDLVITDLQMPGQDGLTLLREIKSRFPQMPVVMLTAYGSMDVVVQALRGGASDFLTKPYKPDELFNIVAREVSRHRQSLPPGVQEGLGLQFSAEALDEIEQLLLNLRVEINARSVLLIAGNGSVITAKGVVEDINISALGALVAGDFAATAGIASLIGEEEAFKLNFHEGAQYSIYSGQVVPGIYLLVIFTQDIRLGAVLFYTKETLAKLRPLVETALIRSAPTVEVAAPAVVAVEPQAVQDTAPVVPSPAAAEETPASTQLFSFDELLKSGALDPDLLTALENQFANLWEPT